MGQLTLVGAGPAVTMDQIPPSGGGIDTGTEVGGTLAYVQQCSDAATWDIEETGAGLAVWLTFSVAGASGKVKVKGKASTAQSYIVRAWDGAEWDSLGTISMDTVDGTYTVSIPSAYIIDGQTTVQIYRATGTNEKLYLDCVMVLATATPVPSGSALLLDQGGYLLKESGNFLLLE